MCSTFIFYPLITLCLKSVSLHVLRLLSMFLFPLALLPRVLLTSRTCQVLCMLIPFGSSTVKQLHSVLDITL